MTVNPLNCKGYTHVLCLNLPDLEEHFGLDILDKPNVGLYPHAIWSCPNSSFSSVLKAKDVRTLLVYENLFVL